MLIVLKYYVLQQNSAPHVIEITIEILVLELIIKTSATHINYIH